MGLATGCIGMSLEDFYQCTPFEFRQIFDAWNKMHVQCERQSWERIRMLCMCSLQPYSKKELKVTDIMRFPWENEIGCEKKVNISNDKLIERYEAVKKQRGLT